ncbi:hypothetical protein CDAR_446101 [Caerostris darwini]|uniref:Uncharacterized protein n=1 Tax=Caerostris darwini TaxID=1538125 RepID=A0AAV4SPK0_9ARAC|nr:hypothetical protein CDAR_446101 [Caerostris darwini]
MKKTEVARLIWETPSIFLQCYLYFLITLHPRGELDSVPRLLHETSLPFQGPRAGNSAFFEAGIDELRFMQAEKNMSSLKKNACSVHEREKAEIKTAWKR